MLDKDSVLQTIIEFYNNEGKPISTAKLSKLLKSDKKDIEKALIELEEEGKIRKTNKGYEPVFQNTCEVLLKEVKLLKDKLLKVLENNNKEKKITTKEFDEAYERIRDSLGYAPLERIRIELGLSKEDFYSKFRKYIEENYELIAGGEEGYVRRGVLYGIVKRKKGVFV